VALGFTRGFSGGVQALGCRPSFNCGEACPRDINITRAIGEVKKELLFRKF